MLQDERALPAHPPRDSSSPRARSAAWLAPALLLAVLVGLAYGAFGGVFEGTFVYDDLVLIQRNPAVTGSLGWWDALTTPHWGFYDPRADDVVGYWRPLTVLALRLTYAVGRGEPEAFHALSLALHYAAALAAWRLFARLFGSGRLGFLAAVVFALHPVHVESVAWSSAVNDPLAGLFVLLALGAYVAWRQDGSRRVPWVAGAWLLAGCLAKEVAIAGALLVAGLELVLPAARAQRGARVRALAPIVAALLFLWLARALVFEDWRAGFDRINTHFQMGLARAATFRVEILGGFLGLLALPLRLQLFRPFRPALPPLDATLWLAVGAIAVFLALAYRAWKKRDDVLLALWLAIPVALSPVLVSVAAAGDFPFSDRYLYVGAAAFAGALVLLASRVLPPRALTAAVAALAALYVVRIATRVPVWKSGEALFRAAAAESPRSPYVQWGLGRVLLAKHARTSDPELAKEALAHFLTSLMLGHDYGERAPKLPPDAPLDERLAELERAVHDTPRDALRPDPTVWVTADDRLNANVGQGLCYLAIAKMEGSGDYDVALLVLQQQTVLFPESHLAWTALGTVHKERGELDEALAAYAKALRIHPGHPEAWAGQGAVLVAKEDWDGARACFERTLELVPDSIECLVQIAATAIEADRHEIAERAIAAARALEPASLQPTYLAGMLAAARNEWSQALAQFDAVIERLPDHGLAHLQRGTVLLRLGQVTEAVRALAIACEHLPSSFEAHYNLGVLMHQDGEVDAARRYLSRAYELAPAGAYRDEAGKRLLQLVAGDVPALRSLAQLSRRREDWPAVLTWVSAALASEPEWADGHYQRGQAWWRVGGTNEARASYERALELVPDHFWSHHDLGVMLHSSGDAAAALAHLRRTLELLDAPSGPGTMQPGLREAMRQDLEKRVALCDEAIRAAGTNGSR